MENDALTLVLDTKKDDILLDINVDLKIIFESVLICRLLEDQTYEIETRILFDDNIVRTVFFPRVSISYGNGQIILTPLGDVLFQAREEEFKE